VGSALGYNAGIKATPLSPLPYLVSFGLLPAVATTAREAGGWPPAGILVAGSMLGMGAHFADTVGDAEADRLTGVRGLPQRLGPRWSLVVTAATVGLAASAVLAVLGRRTPTGVALLTVGAALAGAVALIPAARAGRRTAFRLVVGAVGLVIAGLLASS
jgi:4-hydroxybenzoate polyprenyltransferase